MSPRHALQDTLISLGLSRPDSFEMLFPRTRDNPDVAVLRCADSGVVVLSRMDHVDARYYAELKLVGSWTLANREDAIREFRADDERRADMIRADVRGRRWIDVGTETGGILRILRDEAAAAIGVEPKDDVRRLVESEGFRCYAHLEDVELDDVDVVTMFHVFEHLTDPVGTLTAAFRVLKPGGLVVLEVPHARDALFNRFDLDAFKAFTFWSEHLILHTRESLSRFAAHCGFEGIAVEGVQRFSLANHLYWLRHHKPGGHVAWRDIDSPELRAAYENVLRRLDQTDTLVLTARKPRSL